MKQFVLGLGLFVSLSSPLALSAAPSPVVGAYVSVETFQPEVVGAAHFAVFTLNQDQPSALRLEKILSAESQIVAGVNYRLKLLLSSQEGQYVKEVVVFHQAWTHTWQLVSVTDLAR